MLPLQLPNPTNSCFLVSSLVSVRNLGCKQKESGNNPSKWELVERISVAPRTDRWFIKQEARGLGAPAEGESGLFSFAPLPLQCFRLQPTLHSRFRVPGDKVTFVKQVLCPVLPSRSYHPGEKENLAPYDSTMGDGEMDTDSPKPHILCSSF